MKARTVNGTIVAIQEERFRLETDRGQGFLLTVGNSAPVEMDELNEWYQSNTPVTVEFRGESNEDSGIAYSVRPAAVSL